MWQKLNWKIALSSGVVLLIASYMTESGKKWRENEVAWRIHQEGLEPFRENKKLLHFANEAIFGLCYRKKNEQALVTIEKQEIHMADIEYCGSITTDSVVKQASTASINNNLIKLNHLFIERAQINYPSNGPKFGDIICIAVEKLEYLPEYSTEGVWYVFPKCQPLNIK